MNLLVDQGGFRIEFREPILGGNRASHHKTATLSEAVAEFNTLSHLSLSEGKPFATPMRISRINTMGEVTHIWTQEGRYSVPRLIGGSMADGYVRSRRRASKRRNRRSNRG